ncbi:MAG: hypothetical protein J7539_02750 [Niabella sp.]|nr:hypothetical protein [Niabella sp.]
MRKKSLSVWLLFPYIKMSKYYNILISSTFSRLSSKPEPVRTVAEEREETLPFLYCWYKDQVLSRPKEAVKMRPQVHN